MDSLPSPILRLPAELRLQIWEIYYTLVKPPWLHYHNTSTSTPDPATSVSITRSVDFAPTYTCRLFHAEVTPAIWASLTLHIARNIETPAHHQHSILPPASQRDKIRSIKWHINSDNYRELCRGGVPTHNPFPFHLFTSLREFSIVYADEEHVHRLFLCGGTPASDAAAYHSWDPAYPYDGEAKLYRLLSAEGRLRKWLAVPRFADADAVVEHVAGLGEGGWLSWLVDPARFSAPLDQSDVLRSGGVEVAHVGGWNMGTATKGYLKYNDPSYDNDDAVGAVVSTLPSVSIEGARRMSEAPPPQASELAHGGQEELERFLTVASNASLLIEVELYTEGGGHPLGYPTTVVDMPILLIFDVRQRRLVEARELSINEHRRRQKWRLSPATQD